MDSWHINRPELDKAVKFTQKILLQRSNMVFLFTLESGQKRVKEMVDKGIRASDLAILEFLDIVVTAEDDSGKVYSLSQKGRRITRGLRNLITQVNAGLPGGGDEKS